MQNSKSLGQSLWCNKFGNIFLQNEVYHFRQIVICYRVSDADGEFNCGLIPE